MSNNPKRKDKRKDVPHRFPSGSYSPEEKFRRSQQRGTDILMKKIQRKSSKQKRPRGKNREYIQGKK